MAETRQECEFPGKQISHRTGPVQIQTLAEHLTDQRTGKPLKEFGFETQDVFKKEPWTNRGNLCRKMKFINPHNGDDFTEWYKGTYREDAANILEPAPETLGTLEGSRKAVEYFNSGIKGILESIEEAEKENWKSFVYMYTPHPDKHMHKLGTAHAEVKNVLNGISKGIQDLWKKLEGLDVTLVVTADHGHVTVKTEDMVLLPQKLLDCLEYANVGYAGKGRHPYFHCRSGRRDEFQKAGAKFFL